MFEGLATIYDKEDMKTGKFILRERMTAKVVGVVNE